MMELRLVCAALALLVALWAAPGKTDPVTIEWTNTADESFPSATRALLCVGQFCSMATTACAPRARCTTTHNLAPGVYDDAELMVSSPQFGFAWSVPVPGRLVVPALNPGGTCQHDSNGDGAVTTADFGTFFREFRNGCGD